MNNFRNPKYSMNHYNLLVHYDISFWENNVAVFPRDRFLENTYGNTFENGNHSLEQHSEYLKKLINYPCLFLYERQSVNNSALDIMGYIGNITSFFVGSSSITINFDKESTISSKDIQTMSAGLQIEESGKYVLNRTRWSVKNVNIYDVVESHLELLENKEIIVKPKVFFSYSWDLQSTKKAVEELVLLLRNEGVNVIYDKDNLKAGNNMSYFMESIVRDNFTKIYVFCDKSYIEKANERTGGVGKEVTHLVSYVYNHPNQIKVIPLTLDGSYDAPHFLKDVNGFNISPSNWYNGVNDILNNIFEH